MRTWASDSSISRLNSNIYVSGPQIIPVYAGEVEMRSCVTVDQVRLIALHNWLNEFAPLLCQLRLLANQDSTTTSSPSTSLPSVLDPVNPHRA